MSCGKKRDIIDSMWSVFTSFGFYEVENEEGTKYCIFDKETSTCVNKLSTVKAKAETAAVCIEAAIANGLDNFEVIVGDKNVFELLTLFGFEKLIKLNNEESGFSVVCKDIEFAKGTFKENYSECKIDINKFINALESEGVDMSDSDVSASLMFAEKNAEGIAYDIAYSLRVNGCIVEFFNEDTDISEAEKYADEKKMSCILRAYPDGRLLMKDLIKNEITETTAQDFLGFYDEEDECDCGCSDENHHHHGEDCDCGCH